MLGDVWRRLAAFGLVSVVMAGLSACSVPVIGLVGVGRDPQGVLRVYVRNCERVMSYAALEPASDGSTGSYPSPRLAEWEITADARSLKIDWPLQGPGEGGVVTTRPLSSASSVSERLLIGAWSGDSNYRSEGPNPFTLGELATIKPGQVLIADRSPYANPLNVVVAIEDFNDIDCTQFG